MCTNHRKDYILGQHYPNPGKIIYNMAYGFQPFHLHQTCFNKDIKSLENSLFTYLEAWQEGLFDLRKMTQWVKN